MAFSGLFGWSIHLHLCTDFERVINVQGTEACNAQSELCSSSSNLPCLVLC